MEIDPYHTDELIALTQHIFGECPLLDGKEDADEEINDKDNLDEELYTSSDSDCD